MMLEFDHFVLSCTDLEGGQADVALPWLPGGEHTAFGTHNRVLSLGAGDYLELIAINPVAPAPAQPRWFDLDRFSGPTRDLQYRSRHSW